MDFDVEKYINELGPEFIKYGIKAVGALLFLIVGRMVAGFIKSAVIKSMESRKVDKTVTSFIANIVYTLILLGVIIAALGLFGVQPTAFVAVIGAAGLAVGLALQGSLSNFAAGVMLLVFRPFKVGDFVDAGGVSGTVKEIQLFSTMLDTGDNVRIIIPNSKIYGGIIKNFSFNDRRRVDIVFGIGYESSIDDAISTISEIVNADTRLIREPAEPFYAVTELADSSVNIVLRAWCKKGDYWGMKFDLTKKIKEAFDQKGIEIPFPQRVVHHRNQA